MGHDTRIGCASATINRELASLRRAFKLARKQVNNVPEIKLAKEHNRRTRFFEWHDFGRVRDHLPEYLRPVITVAYYTGWRVPSELLTRTKKHIVSDMLVLDFEEAKNDESRQFTLDVIPELRETIERQLEATHSLKSKPSASSRSSFTIAGTEPSTTGRRGTRPARLPVSAITSRTTSGVLRRAI